LTTPEPSTTLVLQAPVPVRLINKSSGVSIYQSFSYM
ncbi:unnamed protein product, partial [Rotaria magnacalcarata]